MLTMIDEPWNNLSDYKNVTQWILILHSDCMAIIFGSNLKLLLSMLRMSENSVKQTPADDDRFESKICVSTY